MKKSLIITYASIGVVTLGLFAPLTIWAASDQKNYTEVEIVNAELVLDENVRLEYIEQEKFDTTGITFNYEKKTASMDELKINYNFNISGTRVVEFIKEVGNKNYRALLPVHVYHVRHLDVRDVSLYKNDDGSWDNSKLTVWADLNEPSKSFIRPEGISEEQTLVQLTSNQYTFSTNPTAVKGVYSANVTVGNATANFNYYDSYTFDSERVLIFTNQSNTNEKLTLFAENSSNDFTSIKYGEELNVTGKYLYEDSDGYKHLYNFAYTKPINGWESVFKSHTVSGEVNDYFDNETSGVKCVINGTTFYASPEEWHNPILGKPEDDPTPPPQPIETNAEIVVGANAQLEYFEGETINLTDLSFKYGDEVIDINETEIEYDFSSSGNKNVVFTKVIDEETYVAALEVKVLKVKTIDIRNNNVTKISNTEFDFSNIEVWVDLDGQSSRLEKPDDFPNPEQTAYILTSEYYEITTQPSTFAGVYDCTLTVGSASKTFHYYEEESFNQDRILHLHNRNGNGDKLTLFVLTSSTDFEWGIMEITVTGEYLYETAAGDKYLYEFYYHKANNSWTSEFKSAEHNGYRLIDFYSADEDPEGFTAVVGDVYFYTLKDEWHGPVLNF